MEFFKRGVPYFDREISWLSFNERVLQEAEDPLASLPDRVHFLAIFSSNLNEFFKVRVASLRHLIRMEKNNIRRNKYLRRLDAIKRKSIALQQQFGEIHSRIFEQLLPEKGIYLMSPTDLDAVQKEKVMSYYQNEIAQHISLNWLTKSGSAFLKNERLYLFFQDDENRYGLASIPSDKKSRFFTTDSCPGCHQVVMLDDVVRLGLLRHHKIQRCYAIKLNRDAELYLHDELADSVKEKVQKSLKKRDVGIPSRFLYDMAMPLKMQQDAMKMFGLQSEDMVEGGRYHNLDDYWFFPFPETLEKKEGIYPVVHRAFEKDATIVQAIAKKDHLLFFPYQDFQYIIRYLNQLAAHPGVSVIKTTLYRAAENSQVFNALVKAARNGKSVTVFNEVQARFDEARNLQIGKMLEEAGVKVIYSREGLKVHAKMVWAVFIDKNLPRYQSMLSTGNFNEQTAGIYSDIIHLTSDYETGAEVGAVFDWLEKPNRDVTFHHLMVAPRHLRERMESLIDYEIRQVKAGQKAEIFCKMNSLQDARMIARLYEASRAGVRIRLIVRGICCLIPQRNGWSENIEVRSIVGRFLEHARVFMFYHGGNMLTYAGSADWMTRNLNRRGEVVFPVKDPSMSGLIHAFMEWQWADNQKSRIINEEQSNPFSEGVTGRKVNSQEKFFDVLGFFEDSGSLTFP